MDVLVGILMILLGLLVAFYGLRLWFIVLPILGFIAGFSLGLALMRHLFDNHPFLATTAGVILGFVLALVFAAISYLWWYVGVILGAAFVGANIGSGIMEALNVDSQWVIAVVAIVGAVLLGLLTVFLNLPVYLVIVNSAILGAMAAIGGVMLVFNRIDRQDLGYGVIAAAIEEKWYWVLAVIVLAAAAIAYQLMRIALALLPENKWQKVDSSLAAV